MLAGPHVHEHKVVHWVALVEHGKINPIQHLLWPYLWCRVPFLPTMSLVGWPTIDNGNRDRMTTHITDDGGDTAGQGTVKEVRPRSCRRWGQHSWPRCRRRGEARVWVGVVRVRNLGFSLLMHGKFMHELCSLLMHIPTYLDIMRCYNHVLH
jgi:hypothetical protein